VRFSFFQVFKSYGRTPSVDEIYRYLRDELGYTLKELSVGLQKLSLEDNFDSFKVEVEIPAGEEVKIRNQLRDREVTQRHIVRGNEYSKDIADGETPWDLNFVYLKNYGSGTATATVLFTR
jgi:hypothetical protein